MCSLETRTHGIVAEGESKAPKAPHVAPALATSVAGLRPVTPKVPAAARARGLVSAGSEYPGSDQKLPDPGAIEG